jgi:quinoprotein glucose dehydrogenase
MRQPRSAVRRVVASACVIAAIVAVGCAEFGTQHHAAVPNSGEWLTWGGDLAYSRYSPLDQIRRNNVATLQVAWRWRGLPLNQRPDTNWKATPIFVGGVLYVPTGGTQVAAINPATGDTLWVFTPDPLYIGGRQFTGSSRALSYWTDGKMKRLIHNTVDGRLISIDAETGKPDPGFGDGGYVMLKDNLLDPDDHRKVAFVGSTVPATVVGNVIVVQVMAEPEMSPLKEGTPGYIRGYDVRTGKRLWVFHTVPRGDDFGVSTWEKESWRYTGNTGVWAMISADPELGYVYVPVSSASNDFYGGQRLGDNLFSDSIVCLDAKTGKHIWHFQVAHHELWDYDLPAAPILHDVVIKGQRVKAVTVLTKQNMVFVFNRVTGKPIWPIVEKPVPASTVPGEHVSATQPFPTRPAPLSNLGYNEDDLIDFTPELRAQALKMINDYVHGPMYTPPGLVGAGIATKGTLVYPSFGGGSNWNGGAVDLETDMLYVPTRNEYMATGLRRPAEGRTDWDYVAGGPPGAGGAGGWMRGPQGLPMNRPPWAQISAINMNTAERAWSRSIGGAPDWIRNHPALKGLKLDFDNMGQLSVKPSPLVTKTLLFLAESSNIGGDPGGRLFRAYDKATGQVLAEIELPAKTSGAPMTYEYKGRQYIAITLAEQNHPAELVALGLPGAGSMHPSTSNQQSPVGPRVSTTPPAETVTATPEQLSAGHDVYARNCANCHGPEGQGSTQQGAPALRNAGSYQEIRSKVVAGGPQMPAMGTLLTDQQLDAVSQYVAVKLSAPVADGSNGQR